MVFRGKYNDDDSISVKLSKWQMGTLVVLLLINLSTQFELRFKVTEHINVEETNTKNLEIYKVRVYNAFKANNLQAEKLIEPNNNGLISQSINFK